MKWTTIIIAIIVVVVVGVLALLATTQSPAPSPTQTPAQQTPAAPAEVVKIGFLGPVSTTYGQIALRSVQLAVDEINAKGGLLGKRIEVVVFDDNNQPDVAVTGFRKLWQEDRVVAIFGVHSSAVGLALLPLIKESKIPLFAMGSTSDAIDARVANDTGYRYWFRFLINASMHALMVTEPAKYLAKKYGFTRVGILYDQHAWTEPVVKRAKAELQAAGLSLVYEGTIDPGKTSSFVPHLTKARDAGVQMLLVWTAYGDGKVLQRDYYSMKPPFVLVQFDVVGMGLAQWNVTEGSLPYQFFAFYYVATSPGAKEFANRYAAKYGLLTYFYPPFTMYDAVMAWKTAVENAKSFGGDAVADYLEKHGYNGISGRWVFTKGHSPMFGPGYFTTVLVQWLPEGKIVTVWPPELAEAEPQLPPWVPKS